MTSLDFFGLDRFTLASVDVIGLRLRYSLSALRSPDFLVDFLAAAAVADDDLVAVLRFVPLASVLWSALELLPAVADERFVFERSPRTFFFNGTLVRMAACTMTPLLLSGKRTVSVVAL